MWAPCFSCATRTHNGTDGKVKQSKAKQSKAKQSKAKQSKTKQSNLYFTDKSTYQVLHQYKNSKKEECAGKIYSTYKLIVNC